MRGADGRVAWLAFCVCQPHAEQVAKQAPNPSELGENSEIVRQSFIAGVMMLMCTMLVCAQAP